MRGVLVVIHAGSGIVGLLAGLLSFAPPREDDRRGLVRAGYVACIAVLFASLVWLIVLDWRGLDATARIAFPALGALAAVMIVRILLANREASVRKAGWQDRYIGHVFFTYISLWEGFVILPALSLPLPQVSVPLVALGVLVIGQVLLGRYKRRIAAVR